MLFQKISGKDRLLSICIRSTLPRFGPWINLKCIIITHGLFPSFVWFNTNRLHKIKTVVKTKVELFGLIFGLSLNMIYESESIKWWFKLIVSLLEASEIIFSLIESRVSCRLSHVRVQSVFSSILRTPERNNT